MLGALIGAGASILGNVLQNNANEKKAQQQYEQQKEFAQSGIQWKVQDAEKAGIHPLYALGANTVSYSPTSVGGADWSGIGQAGQNIGRALDATRSQPARMAAAEMTGVQIEGAKLDNDLKRAQLASLLQTTRQAGAGPAMPNAATMPAGLTGMQGQGDTPQTDAQITGPKIEVEKKISPISPGQPFTESGRHPEVRWYQTPTGYAPMVPEALSESFESDWPSKYQWFYRNKIAPAQQMGPNFNPPFPAGPNQKWVYYLGAGEYRLEPILKPGSGNNWRRR